MPSFELTASSNQKMLIRFTLLALALLGFFSVLIATRWGAGTSPDSVVYIAGARNLAAGRGFSMILENGQLQAITHHAPLYSAALALLDILGLDPMHGARWLNALLFAANILLVGFLISELLPGRTAQAVLAPVLGAGLILAPVMMVEIHSMAWSESLFLFLLLTGFWLLSRFIENPSRGDWLGSAILIGLAFLTRYVGVVLVATAGLSILLFSRLPFRRRLVEGVLFGLIAVGPMALWMLRNSLVGGTATSRELLFHPVNRQQMGVALTTLGSWFQIPADSLGEVKILPYLALGLVVALVVIARHRQSEGKIPWTGWATLSAFPALVRILLVFIPLYLAFLFLSLSFLDANTPLDARILSPVYVTGVILALYFLAEALSWLSRPAMVRFALIGLSFVFVGAYAVTSLDYVQSGYVDGIGFTSRWWRESPTLAALQNYPSDGVVYSNAPEALYLHTGRYAESMPKKFESANRRPNELYETELLALKEQIHQQGGVIVYFDPMLRPMIPSPQEIRQVLGLDVLMQTADGVIYGIKGQNSAGRFSSNL